MSIALQIILPFAVSALVLTVFHLVAYLHVAPVEIETDDEERA